MYFNAAESTRIAILDALLPLKAHIVSESKLNPCQRDVPS